MHLDLVHFGRILILIFLIFTTCSYTKIRFEYLKQNILSYAVKFMFLHMYTSLVLSGEI